MGNQASSPPSYWTPSLKNPLSPLVIHPSSHQAFCVLGPAGPVNKMGKSPPQRGVDIPVGEISQHENRTVPGSQEHFEHKSEGQNGQGDTRGESLPGTTDSQGKGPEA